MLPGYNCRRYLKVINILSALIISNLSFSVCRAVKYFNLSGSTIGSLFVLFVFFFSGSLANAKQWARTYGGTNIEQANSVYQTSDGGYIVAGCTYSYGAGNGDLWVLKFNSDGSLSWQKTYGGIDRDCANSIQQTDDDVDGQKDDGYIVTGASDSFGTGADLWIMKLNSDGSVAWQKTYVDSARDEAWSIQQAAEGGYIAAGPNRSSATGDDFWVLKLGSDGSVVWQKKYGGIDADWAYSVKQTDDDADGQKDDGYIVGGYTASFGAGGRDVWVVKLNADGSVAWEKTYGTNNNEEAKFVQQTADGGYIVSGSTADLGDVNSDVWVLKLNTDGTVAWEKTYGGTAWDGASFIHQTGDGGYIVSGGTSSYGSGLVDAWVLRLSENGFVVWEKTYGGTSDDWVSSFMQATDGGYVLAGMTWSFGAGSSDAWILKLNGSGEILDCSAMGTSSASVNNTNATVNDTNATITSTSITGTDTNAAISTPSSSEAEVCLANAEITLPQTGQTTCYDTAGDVISCTGTGQDGDIQAGVPWPDPRFIDNGDGTVTDRLTGLMWTQDGNTPGPVSCSPGTTKTWQWALDYVACLNTNSYLGYTDWRLPNVIEIESLANAGKSNTAIWLNTQGFSNVQSNSYWSSTTSAYSPDYAWLGAMWGGETYFHFKSLSFYVWPVRSGQLAPAQLWETGQTTCYDTAGEVILCAGTGQDGDIKAGVLWPSPRFTVSTDGYCVTDNLTGLMWAKDANVSGNYKNWQQALDYANNLMLCGYTDWRLPDRKELLSLIDFSRENPALPLGHPFLNVQSSNYWSSTSNAFNPNNAWFVDMWASYKIAFNKSNSYSVWPVRSGQAVQTWFEEDDTVITYTGTWNSLVCNPCKNGFIKYSGKTGAKAEFSFYGTGIKWHTAKAPSLGKAKIYFNGVYKGMVDLYSPNVQYPVVLGGSGLPQNDYTLTIEVSGQKNPNSAGYYIPIDAFDVVP